MQVAQPFRPVGITEIDQVNAKGQVVERDFVARSGAVTEIDRVNAAGQLFERDFIVGGSSPQVPAVTIAPQAAPKHFHTAVPTTGALFPVPSGNVSAAYRSYMPRATQVGPPLTARLQTRVPMASPSFNSRQFGPPMPRPVSPPRPALVDRPFPVAQDFPVAVPVPGSIEHMPPKMIVPREVYDFPYHDPAFGVGWRCNDSLPLDELWNQAPMYQETPLQELLHRREDGAWRDLWERAHMGESENLGWRYRPAPFSRRVRHPDKLIPSHADFYHSLDSWY